MYRNMEDFDKEKSEVLRRMWFLGDIHGDFRHIADALIHSKEKPLWLVFLGDLDLKKESFKDILEPLKICYPDVKVAFIHGNHDGDSHDHWDLLHDCGDAVALHGQVRDLNGIKVAGLGGNFIGRVWRPPSNPVVYSRKEATEPGFKSYSHGDKPPAILNAAIYKEDFKALSKKNADILVTHEAPGCNPDGWEALSDLARSMRVVRSFHGHLHDDKSDNYAIVRSKLRFDARAVSYCGIKDGHGNLVRRGPCEATA